MDRPRRRSQLLILAAAAGLAAAAPPPEPPPLRALNWLPPQADAVRALTTRPVECLARPTDPETAYRVEVGRAAFRTPLLLGGQAARAGIACESCHTNGRRNANFDFPGVSGAPGTADVTSFVFSSHRGDSLDDPRPIPDLGGPKSRLKVDQAPGSGALEHFIHGLVTEEFDGPPPPAGVLNGLAAYVRALSPAACAAGPEEPVTLAGDLEDARRAASAARAALIRGEPDVAVVMMQAARSRLGVIAERFAGHALGRQRRTLAALDLDLAADLAEARQSSERARTGIDLWLSRLEEATRDLHALEARSLYSPDRLAMTLGHRGGGAGTGPAHRPL